MRCHLSRPMKLNVAIARPNALNNPAKRSATPAFPQAGCAVATLSGVSPPLGRVFTRLPLNPPHHKVHAA